MTVLPTTRGGTKARCTHAGLAIAFTTVTLVAASGQTSGQAPYPNRPIRLIVPYPPGAGTDFTGREVGAIFSKALGQSVVIDNRGGAAATIGHALGAKAPPDGYTLLLGTTGGLVSGPALVGSRIPYDPLQDFATIGLATYVPYASAEDPPGGVRSNAETLLCYEQGRSASRVSQTLTERKYGINGTTLHLSGELFKRQDRLRHSYERILPPRRAGGPQR